MVCLTYLFFQNAYVFLISVILEFLSTDNGKTSNSETLIEDTSDIYSTASEPQESDLEASYAKPGEILLRNVYDIYLVNW